MADIELVIKISEGLYNDIKSLPFTTLAEDIIINGTPLEKHDEEVIEETVESIWGKPPYTEMLDKIRDEIEKLQKMCDTNDLNLLSQHSAFGMALDIIDKYRKGCAE